MSFTPLSETQIRHLSTSQSFQRGQQYYQDGAIRYPTRQGNCLYADCVGSQVYRVRVRVASVGEINGACSCPYDWGGLCKHQVALLLAYLHQPEIFALRSPLTEELKSWSKKELIELIEWMSQGSAELLSLMTAFKSQNTPVESYRQTIASGFGLPTVRSLLEHLEPWLEMAQEGIHQKRYGWSCELLMVLLQEVTQGYTAEFQGLDYDGQVCGFSQGLIARLGECFRTGELEATTRRILFETLLSAIGLDLDAGGISYADGAAEILLTAAEEEWQEIEGQLQQAVPRGNDWAKKRVEKWVAQRKEQERFDSKQVTCPYCQSTEISKYGRRRGKQNYRCGECNRQFVESAQPKQYPPEVKERCLQLAASGYGVREIGRITGVHFSTVSKWLKS
ncbi:hypothetical protein PMG71_04785 [Roseofilum sp. BLCC_M154]|uniref:SWIM-type domain-containing protein n=1 Tax=Roseofilum acuticapitatum BLCC-M154 TaxID=3022444 RepID=A0ABT7APA8_9CYAN|nr:hypothetical protein [Roseofilum acuticapitatum]MDJ1168734.1 hypothetical protein [Roseofilum acuticapitatum BLCC-M154]